MTIPTEKYPKDYNKFLSRETDSSEFLFDGLPVKNKPTDGYPAKPERLALCPACKGHGGWNLTLNAYGQGKHFQCHCSNCLGYGYVIAGSKDETCIHEWEERSLGRCLHEWTCKKCGQKRVVDTSD